VEVRSPEPSDQFAAIWMVEVRSPEPSDQFATISMVEISQLAHGSLPKA
jgi:hypothetical protein